MGAVMFRWQFQLNGFLDHLNASNTWVFISQKKSTQNVMNNFLAQQNLKERGGKCLYNSPTYLLHQGKILAVKSSNTDECHLFKLLAFEGLVRFYNANHVVCSFVLFCGYGLHTLEDAGKRETIERAPVCDLFAKIVRLHLFRPPT